MASTNANFPFLALPLELQQMIISSMAEDIDGLLDLQFNVRSTSRSMLQFAETAMNRHIMLHTKLFIDGRRFSETPPSMWSAPYFADLPNANFIELKFKGFGDHNSLQAIFAPVDKRGETDLRDYLLEYAKMLAGDENSGQKNFYLDVFQLDTYFTDACFLVTGVSSAPDRVPTIMIDWRRLLADVVMGEKATRDMLRSWAELDKVPWNWHKQEDFAAKSEARHKLFKRRHNIQEAGS